MNAISDKSTGLRILVAMAALVVIVAGIRAASDLLVPFLLSAFLAVISLPPLHWLRRHGTPTWASILIVAGSLVMLVTILAAMIAPSIGEFNSKLPDYQERVEQEVDRIEGWWEEKSGKVRSWFDGLSREDAEPPEPPADEIAAEAGAEAAVDEQIEASAPTATKKQAAAAADTSKVNATVEPAAEPWYDAQSILALVRGTLTNLASVLSNAFLILITVIFMLLETTSIPNKIRAMPGDTTQSLDNLEKIVATINQYMAIKTITSLLTGVLVTVWLMVVGVDFALLWGLLAFLLNYVPNIGSILAAVPAVLLAFIQLGPGGAAMAGLGFLVVNTLVGYAIEPRFMGRGLGLSTLVVFLSLVFWGWVLGPVGMLLSVPLTMTAKIMLEGNDRTRWIAILLGTGSDAAASVPHMGPENIEELIDIDKPPTQRG